MSNLPGVYRSSATGSIVSFSDTATVDQIKGFSLYMIKAILDGRGREILDLAKTNLAH
jgi:hypothetical protein